MGLKSFWDFLEMNFLVGNVVIVRINDLKKSWFLCRLRLSIINVFFFCCCCNEVFLRFDFFIGLLK